MLFDRWGQKNPVDKQEKTWTITTQLCLAASDIFRNDYKGKEKCMNTVWL